MGKGGDVESNEQHKRHNKNFVLVGFGMTGHRAGKGFYPA